MTFVGEGFLDQALPAGLKSYNPGFTDLGLCGGVPTRIVRDIPAYIEAITTTTIDF